METSGLLRREPKGSREPVLSKHDIGLNGFSHAVRVAHDAEIRERLARQQCPALAGPGSAGFNGPSTLQNW